jgi:hypothetical protein
MPFLTTGIGALLGLWIARKLERDRESRTKHAVAVVLQAEMIRLHFEIKEHNKFLTAYAERFKNYVNSVESESYTPLSMASEFTVYRSVIKEIGLFSTESAYGILYCYANILEFMSQQDLFVRDLPRLANSNILGIKAAELCAREMALTQHIERVVPDLAAQSLALPFEHS